jgi:iron complex outermembrane recepter protein
MRGLSQVPKTNAFLVSRAVRFTMLAMGCGPVAVAQTATAPPATGSAAPVQPATLEEIVVTAQKRSESSVNVPISITAVSGSRLNESGVPDVSTLSALVPGLRMDYSGSFAQPTIRGVGSALLGPGLSPNVAIYVDGIIRPSGLTNNIYFLDVDSVQVLKGPQGTLFGRNATGGAILVNSAAPAFEPTVQGRVSYGRYNTLDGAVAASSGFTDTLAASVSAFYQRSDGFVTNVLTGDDAATYKNYGVRAKLLYKPSDAAQLLFTYEHMRTDDLRAIALANYQGWSVGALLGGQAPSTRGTVALDFPSIGTSTYDAAHLKATFDLGWATLTSYTGGQWENDRQSVDDDGSSVPIVGVDWVIKDHTISQEFNLTSAQNDSLNWVGGLYYFNNNSGWPALNLSLGGAPTFPEFSGTLRTRSYAAFADATKTLAEDWYLTLGLRYGSDQVYENMLFLGDVPRTASHNWNNVTPRAVLRYQLTPESNVYASFTRGYKSGVFNVPGDSTTPVNPEKISAFEVGYKVSHPTWRLNSSVYYYDYKDLQITSYLATGSVLVNAANSKIYGLDLDGEFKLTDHLTVTAAGGYIHGRYEDFPNAPGYTWNPALGGVQIAPTDASGFPMERTPMYSGNIGLRYVQPLLGGDLAWSALYSYQSRIYFDPANVSQQAGYGLLNARVQWNAPSNKWDVALYGKNITDKVYINQVLPNTAFFGETFGEPATFGAEFGFKF